MSFDRSFLIVIWFVLLLVKLAVCRLDSLLMNILSFFCKVLVTTDFNSTAFVF